jgi:hypothetical protein
MAEPGRRAILKHSFSQQVSLQRTRVQSTTVQLEDADLEPDMAIVFIRAT